MLNAGWINSFALNSAGSYRPISLAASASASATAPPAVVVVLAGMASAAIAVATATARPGQTMLASALASATSSRAIQIERSLGANTGAFAFGRLLSQQVFALGGLATASASGVGFLGGIVASGDGTATASIAPVEYQRIRLLSPVAMAGTAAWAAATPDMERGLGSVLQGRAAFVGDLDWDRGGVRYAGLSSITSAAAALTFGAVEFRSIMAANAQARATAGQVLPVQRIKALPLGFNNARAFSLPVPMNTLRVLDAQGSAGASAAPPLTRTTPVSGAGLARATSAGARIVRPTAAMASGERTGRATALGEVFRGAALASVSSSNAVAVSTDFRLAIRFTGEGAALAAGDGALFSEVQLTAELPARAQTVGAMAIQYALSALPLAAADALGDLLTNVGAREPEFRTYVVPAQDTALAVLAQDTTYRISTDATGMKTFTKQPGDRLPYDIDFTDWFSEIPADDIETAAASVTEAIGGELADLTVDAPLLLGDQPKVAKVWIEGGITGATYKVTLTINTEGGRRKEVDFRIRVKEI